MSPPVQPSAEDLQAEALARDIAADMPSPYCPGRSIASCPTQAARELEDDILGLAKQGKDREQIEGVLVTRFGEEKMGTASQGEVLVAILLAAAVALGVIVYAARRWLRPAAGGATAATSRGTSASPADPGAGAGGDAKLLAQVSADELDRLEDELDEIDGL